MATATASATASTGCGTSFAGLLTIAFVILKLTHEIAWSWWWVLSPLWISAGTGIVMLLLVLGVAGTVIALKRRRRTSR
jgi:hypothetical protein